MSHVRIVQMSVLALLAFCLSVSMNGQPSAVEQAIRIQVTNEPRPVLAAVLQIERRFGRVVTYEDTRYVHPSDIIDITAQVRQDGNMSKRVFGMRSGSIDVTYTPRSSSIDDQVGELLQAVIENSSAAGNTGEFRVDWVPGGHHVVPVAMKGKSGLKERYTSPLEARITLPYREESGLELLLRMANAISKASGADVQLGTMPMTHLDRARVAVGAQDERARDVLWRALQSMAPELSWTLRCVPGEKGMCGLNIQIVPKK